MYIFIDEYVKNITIFEIILWPGTMGRQTGGNRIFTRIWLVK